MLATTITSRTKPREKKLSAARAAAAVKIQSAIRRSLGKKKASKVRRSRKTTKSYRRKSHMSVSCM